MCSNITPVTKDDYPRLIEIWDEAVRATHSFLSAEHFDEIKRMLPEYFAACEVYAYKDGGEITGFIGLHERNIEMLFVAKRSEGIGRKLLDFATGEPGARTVDVNQQNEAAWGFYLKYGFVETGRSETDPDGRPYPLVHMKLKQHI